MKRLLILLTLPLLACGALNDSIAPTITPLTPLTDVSATETDSQPEPEQNLPSTANSFPNADAYEWKQIISGLKRPVDIQPANDGSGRLFIIEKEGYIRIYENGQLLDTPFLDITDRIDESGNEMGLLGLTFDPNYGQNGFFYVNYTGDRGNTHISRFQASGNSADSNSENNLLIVDQPYENHNGGAIAFGPDGFLYVGLGDGGLAGDPHKNGQDTTVLLGKILRLDVNSGDTYSIPSDNPFGNEVWAYGLRNPWRISFDQVTGDLWIGDVGQGDWEEVDYLPAGSQNGANLGWSIMEGNHGYDGEAQPGLILPVAEYSHSDTYGGCSVTGGYVYRGNNMPEWDGIYLYADYCNGYVWGLFNSNGNWQNQLLFEMGVTITTFGQDEAGELYLASDNGNVYYFTKK